MFSKLIKIPGKNKFDQLTSREVGLMIDSFLGDGNEFFDGLAFNDFLHAKLTNPILIDLQRDLNSNAFIDTGPDEWPEINEPYLKQISEKLLLTPDHK